MINGESWGVYVSAQQFNTDFVRDWFKHHERRAVEGAGQPLRTRRMEYLGDDVDAYKRIYEIKSRDDAKSWARPHPDVP